MFYLYLLAIGELTHKICHIPLHDIPPIDFLQIAVHLSGTWMNRISAIMSLCKDILSQLTHIRNTQSTRVKKYTISPLGENNHSLIMDCSLKFKQDWITVSLFLNLHYQGRFYLILKCYTIVRYAHKADSYFTGSFLSSSTWATLPIDNLLRAHLPLNLAYPDDNAHSYSNP